ncbi:MAG: beta-galactosidase trimerization domain-containing protein [Agathobacter rectalis]
MDQSDSVHLGGYRDRFARWQVSGLRKLTRLHNLIKHCKLSDGKEYKCNLLCDLMPGEVLATYESDFYAGMPAVTKNIYGKDHILCCHGRGSGLARVLDEATDEVSVSVSLLKDRS